MKGYLLLNDGGYDALSHLEFPLFVNAKWDTTNECYFVAKEQLREQVKAEAMRGYKEWAFTEPDIKEIELQKFTLFGTGGYYGLERVERPAVVYGYKIYPVEGVTRVRVPTSELVRIGANVNAFSHQTEWTLPFNKDRSAVPVNEFFCGVVEYKEGDDDVLLRTR